MLFLQMSKCFLWQILNHFVAKTSTENIPEYKEVVGDTSSTNSKVAGNFSSFSG